MACVVLTLSARTRISSQLCVHQGQDAQWRLQPQRALLCARDRSTDLPWFNSVYSSQRSTAGAVAIPHFTDGLSDSPEVTWALNKSAGLERRHPVSPHTSATRLSCLTRRRLK